MANWPDSAHDELKRSVHSAVNREFHCNSFSLKINLLCGCFNFPNMNQLNLILKYAGWGAYVNNRRYFIIVWLSVSLILVIAHTHAHGERERERERDTYQQ